MKKAVWLRISMLLLAPYAVPRSGFAGGPPGRAPGEFLYYHTVRSDWNTVIDLQVAVGHRTELEKEVFSFSCTGGGLLSLSIAWDDSHFSLGSYSEVIECDGTWSGWAKFDFEADQPGMVTTQVTFTTELGVVTTDLIGNGVPIREADYWVADLPPGTYAGRLAYDEERDLLYVGDVGTDADPPYRDKDLVFDPATRQTLATIQVGLAPWGLSITPDGRYLLVANVRAESVSVVDLDAWQEVRRIPIPSLGPFEGYEPCTIAAVTNSLALLGGDPPGSASGWYVYELDLVSGEVSARPDIGMGICPKMVTSRDGSTIAIVVDPFYSPGHLARYDTRTGSLIVVQISNILNFAAISHDGTRIAAVPVYGLPPNLGLYDETLEHVRSIDILESDGASRGAAFFPRGREYVYSIEDTWALSESDVETGVQLSKQTYTLPPGYVASGAELVAADSGWFYALLEGQYLYPSKLLAFWENPPDRVPPVSSVSPLPPEQVHNWWVVSWSGSDNWSSVAEYRIQFRAGLSGEWIDWLSTPGTSGLFHDAVPGQTYYFRSSAVDQAGNVEEYPAAADAFTTAGSDPSGLFTHYLPFLSKAPD
jgi:hypothetical protein